MVLKSSAFFLFLFTRLFFVLVFFILFRRRRFTWLKAVMDHNSQHFEWFKNASRVTEGKSEEIKTDATDCCYLTMVTFFTVARRVT